MAKNIDTAKYFVTTAANIVQALAEVNPRDEEFDSLLDKHVQVCRAALNYMDLQERVSFFLGQMAKVEEELKPTDNITVIDTVRAKEEPVTNQEPIIVDDEPDLPAPEEDPYPEEAEAQTAPLTFDEVKAAFTKAAQDGVPVKPIINELGYEKLSAVPAEKYSTLMEQLALAIKEKS